MSDNRANAHCNENNTSKDNITPLITKRHVQFRSLYLFAFFHPSVQLKLVHLRTYEHHSLIHLTLHSKSESRSISVLLGVGSAILQIGNLENENIGFSSANVSASQINGRSQSTDSRRNLPIEGVVHVVTSSCSDSAATRSTYRKSDNPVTYYACHSALLCAVLSHVPADIMRKGRTVNLRSDQAACSSVLSVSLWRKAPISSTKSERQKLIRLFAVREQHLGCRWTFQRRILVPPGGGDIYEGGPLVMMIAELGTFWGQSRSGAATNERP